MSDRLPTHLLVSALVRRAGEEGGFATVLARGDRDSGAILLIRTTRGNPLSFLERGIGPDGKPQLLRAGPQAVVESQEADDYWRRRRARDPDLWVIELDVADSERFTAVTTLLV